MASIIKITHSNRPADNLLTEEFLSESEKSPLPKVLKARDLTILSLLTVVTLGSTAFIYSEGLSTLLFMLLGLFSFIGPRMIIMRWLSKRATRKETQYNWAASKIGRSSGFFIAICIWWPGIFIVVSTTQAYTELARFSMHPVPAGFSPLQQGLLVVATLFLIALIACIPLRLLKNILIGIAIPYLSVFLLIGCAGIWWLTSGHATAFSAPSWNQWHFSRNNLTAYSQVIMMVLVIYVPLLLNQEAQADNEERRLTTVSRFLWCSGVLACLIIVFGVVGITIIVPPAKAATLVALVYATKSVFGPSVVPYVVFILNTGQIAVAVSALLTYSRLLVLLAREKTLPQQLARTNRYGVPLLSILVQAAVAAVFSILLFIVAPYLISHISSSAKLVLAIDNDINVYIYRLLQTGALLLFASTSSLMYINTLILLYKSRRKGDTPLKQRLLLGLVAIVGLSATFIAIWAIATHSQFPQQFSDSQWTVSCSISVGLLVILGWAASSLPRIQASLQEQRRFNAQEANLRSQLQESYVQQQVLLEEVDHLYREHAQAAVTDAITGLPNHRAVMSKIDDTVAQCRQKQQVCAILFTDLDHFKRVNDTWGHRAGDAILREVARRFRVTLREGDLVGRYGGEEFAIILQQTEFNEAIQIAERLRNAVDGEPCMWQEDGQAPLPIPITTSIGVAVYQLHGVTRETLITSADQAMYRAKRTGRNRVCVADLEQEGHESNSVAQLTADRSSREEAALNALTAVASVHDSVTYNHSHRMVQLAEETARQMQRSEEEVHLIQLAALLHDIGKIGIPDAILHKPGPLTNDEWTIMRSHPDIGRNILEQTGGILRLLASIVVAHHERWDGMGYPMQLEGENIPLGARILSVVDAYDAMISERPYRESRPSDEARTELLRCAGTQFDPQVVEAFLAALAKHDGPMLVESVVE